MTILVCEDNVLTARSLKQALQQSGHEVIISPDGKDGIQVLKQGGVELVITDVNMPYFKGLEIVRFVKTQMDAPVPVIVITAIAQEETREQSEKLGADAYFMKPLDPGELIARIDQLAKS